MLPYSAILLDLDGTVTVTREALVAHCIRLISEASVRG